MIRCNVRWIIFFLFIIAGSLNSMAQQKSKKLIVVNAAAFGLDTIDATTAIRKAVPQCKVAGAHKLIIPKAIELLYADITVDVSKKEEAIRQLNFCTYAVDYDGKCRWMNFDTYEIWWSDGYGDFVRHFIRAMAAAPELPPSFETHTLSSTSVLQKVAYSGNINKNLLRE